MKILKYLFYRLYNLMVSVGNKDVAEYYAVFLMAMLIGLNIYTLVSFIYIFTGQRIDLNQGSNVIILLEYMVLSIALYLLFVRKGKYLEIAKEYEAENNAQRVKGNLIAFTYFLLSIGLIIFSFFLMIKKNKGEL